MMHELTPQELPAPWPERLRQYAALHRQSSHAAQARVQHHATCACRPGQLCLVGQELCDWEAGMITAIGRYQRRYADTPPPLRPAWIKAFCAWYGALLEPQRLSTEEPLTTHEQQAIDHQRHQIGLALTMPAHPHHTTARWLYEAWLAAHYGDEAHHADP
jgi:hypothetical protein